MKARLVFAIATLLAVLAIGLAALMQIQQGDSHSVEAGRLERNGSTVTVDMTAEQWSFNPSAITVRQGDTVTIRMVSRDVPHGFAVEGYPGVLTQFLSPDRVTTLRFTATREGRFVFFCNVFCGEGHPFHRGVLTVTKDSGSVAIETAILSQSSRGGEFHISVRNTGNVSLRDVKVALEYPKGIKWKDQPPSAFILSPTLGPQKAVSRTFMFESEGLAYSGEYIVTVSGLLDGLIQEFSLGLPVTMTRGR